MSIVKKLFFAISIIFLISCEDRDYQDCNGIINGGAYYDDCGLCVGGRTGLTECIVDCNDQLGGTAYLNQCELCVEGNTDIPEDSCSYLNFNGYSYKTVIIGQQVWLAEDLKTYQPKWRKPVKFNYKDLSIISMSPPSSGGICLGQIMKMIAPYDIQSFGHNTIESIHLMVESERRSYADRSHFLGDPDFVKIPVNELIDIDYLNHKMESFSPNKATPSTEVSHGNISIVESDETTHFSIIDAKGNAVAVTTTLNGAYGSKVFIDEIGVFMNNEMDDFSSKPGEPNMFGLTGSEANSIAPKKRMLSSMTPTIVEKNNQLYMIVGTPGGSTIITSVLQAILNVYEHGMSMQEAVNAPRFHHQWLPDKIIFEPDGLSPETITKLQNMGHDIEEGYSRMIGKVDAILVDDKRIISFGADPRGDDAAATY